MSTGESSRNEGSKPQIANPNKGPPTLDEVKARLYRPRRAVITSGMPYANGPLHLGHLAGTHVPADIFARWMRMLIGAENVLFVCGTDDHGSTSELAAIQAGIPVREFIDQIADKQRDTLRRYAISQEVYSGTSHPECYPTHVEVCHGFLRNLMANGLLEKRASLQWYDPVLQRFLQDRFVRGGCPNAKCENKEAFSNECDVCGLHYEPSELIEPRSMLSEGKPELKSTLHVWLDMWKVSETLRGWIQSKEGKWRTAVYNELIAPVLPSLRFSNTYENLYKDLKAQIPTHKSRYAPGKQVVLVFSNKTDLGAAQEIFRQNSIETVLLNDWAHRGITRDVDWGIPMPKEFGAELNGKTLYVWPDSLIAPISFTKVALKKLGRDPAESDLFWKDPEARIYQFLGQDNVFFYGLMQGALWVGSQQQIDRLPLESEYQLTEIFGCYHLMVDGDKMSKSKGNFVSGDQLLDEKGADPDQVRYYLSLLTLAEKASNFDFSTFRERNQFLAGPMNAALEKPISACHSKFNGSIPDGVLSEKAVQETTKIIQRYCKAMERAEYSTLLFAIENYARQINSLFTQHKPHDDRFPIEERKNALYTCFYVLKTLMILLYPFVPATMDRLRQTLNLGPDVFAIEELGTPMKAGHKIGPMQPFFPSDAVLE